MIASWALGAAWGALLAVPVAARARRRIVVERAHRFCVAEVSHGRTSDAETGRSGRTGRRLAVCLPAGPLGRVVGAWARRRAEARDATVVGSELPVTIDLLGVAVGAGCTPYLAVGAAARWAPPVTAGHLAGVHRACELGASLADALDDLAARVPRLRPLVDALLSSERLGAPVGPRLARLAAEERAALRRRAETHARTVPVRLLFPLVFLVLPAFGLLTVVPALLASVGR